MGFRSSLETGPESSLAQVRDLKQVSELASFHVRRGPRPLGGVRMKWGNTCTGPSPADGKRSVNTCCVGWGARPGVTSCCPLQVDCLVLQLHRVGEQLEKMNGQRMDELFVLIRDGFLLPAGLSSLAQLLLLEIVEFRAAGWKTTPAAHKYYYSEVSD